MFFAAPVNIKGGHAWVRDNAAVEGDGGGLCGEGWKAEVKLEASKTLNIVNNSGVDGGGVALLELARLMVVPLECPAECAAKFNDSHCDLECMKPGCNFDGADCSPEFEEAGADAVLPCDRTQCFHIQQYDEYLCHGTCMKASCDWSGANPACDSTIAFAKSCPMFDAQAYKSLAGVPELTYVKPGGTAEGIGRCTTPCSTEAPPVLPEWCTSESCTGEGVGEWCNTVNDNGIVLKLECATCSLAMDLGPSWGACSDKPRLPGHGFQYDPAEMERVLKLPLFELLLEFPGCGSIPLVFKENVASRNGGGLFKSRCNSMSERAEECVLEGMVGSSYAVFQNNAAGAAGGGAYVACHTFGNCAATTGLSRDKKHQRDSIFFLEGNTAMTYGNDLASGPLELALYQAEKQAVPGQGSLNFTFALLDSDLQVMLSPDTFALPFLVSASLCALDEEECSKTTSFQPDTFFFLPPGKSEASTTIFAAPIRYCEVGVNAIKVLLSVIGGGVQAISSLSKQFQITCLPCQAGQALQLTSTGGRHLWSCNPCGPNQYIVNTSDPTIGCQNCPVGADCLNGQLFGHVPGSEWEAIGSQYRLKSCPAGHSLVNSLDGLFSHDVQQCMPCAVNQYILSDLYACQDCPVGARCDGQNLTSLTPGSVWARYGSQMRLAQCPPGHVLVRDERGIQDSCVLCPNGYYSFIPASIEGPLVTSSAVVAASGSLCEPCPAAATCPGGNEVIPQRGHWLKNSWEAANATFSHGRRSISTPEIARLYRCPPQACEEGGVCSEGREGVVCGICREGYAFGNGECIRCNDDLLNFGIAIYVAGAIGFLVVWYTVSIRPLLGAGESWIGGLLGRCLVRFAPIVERMSKGSRVMAVFKVIVGFFQLLGTFLYTFNVSWDSKHNDIMQLSAIASFNIMSLPGPHCFAAEVSPESKMFIYTLGPLLIILLFILPPLFANFIDYVRNKPGRWNENLSSITRPILVLLFVSYPLVTYQALSHFQCQDLGDGLRLLTADYSRTCPLDDKESLVFVWSLFFGVLYSCGIPICFYFVLRAYDVPGMARKKGLDVATWEMVMLYKRRQGYGGDALMHLFRAEPDSRQFPAECNRVYDLVASSSESQRVDAPNIVDLLREHDVMVHPEFVHLLCLPLNDEHGCLDREGFRTVAEAIVRENQTFTGQETFERLNRPQLQRLLHHKWSSAVNEGPGAPEGDDLLSEVSLSSLGRRRSTLENGSQSSRRNSVEGRVSSEQGRQSRGGSVVDGGRSGLIGGVYVEAQHRKQRRESRESTGIFGGVRRLSSTSHVSQVGMLRASVVPEPTERREDLELELIDLIDRLKQLNVIGKAEPDWDGTLGEKEDLALNRVGFLFRGYKVGVWYWEIVEILRKFVFSSLMTFIFPGSKSQLLVGFIATATFFIIAGRLRPFRDVRVEQVHTVASLALAITLFYAIVIQFLEGGSEQDVESSITRFVGWISFLLNSSVLICPIFIEWVHSPSSPYLLWRRRFRHFNSKASHGINETISTRFTRSQRNINVQGLTPLEPPTPPADIVRTPSPLEDSDNCNHLDLPHHHPHLDHHHSQLDQRHPHHQESASASHEDERDRGQRWLASPHRHAEDAVGDEFRGPGGHHQSYREHHHHQHHQQGSRNDLLNAHAGSRGQLIINATKTVPPVWPGQSARSEPVGPPIELSPAFESIAPEAFPALAELPPLAFEEEDSGNFKSSRRHSRASNASVTSAAPTGFALARKDSAIVTSCSIVVEGQRPGTRTVMPDLNRTPRDTHTHPVEPPDTHTQPVDSESKGSSVRQLSLEVAKARKAAAAGSTWA